MRFQAPRGTYDRLPGDQDRWSVVTNTARAAAERFGYGRIDTPVFEDAGLFVRGVGEVTDIVEKETYTFDDRGGTPMTLRAEGTAPVCRAYLEHGMQNLPQPVRLYYFCPVFRYERPQAGRYRQHHQFGVEVIGGADPEIDAEVIELGWQILQELGLSGLRLLVNSMGDMDTRQDYVEGLKDYFRDRLAMIPEEIRERVETNPLRVLDSKDPRMLEVKQDAPRSVDQLGQEAKDHWDTLLGHLRVLDLPYEIEHSMVRGFDYYTRTVFEIVPSEAGSQSTLIGGGRYDGLIEQLGGRPTPGIGFGMGLERVSSGLSCSAKGSAESAPKIVAAHVGDAARAKTVIMASELRRRGFTALVAPSRGLKSQLRYAASVDATHVVLLGEDEMNAGTVTVRDLAAGEQVQVAQGELLDAICAVPREEE